MATQYFVSLVRPFAAGLLDKTKASQKLELNAHQRSRLREAISIDIRKMCDILVPAARYPAISVAAANLAGGMGVDLLRVTWHAQKRIDSYKVFTYEHMTPVAGLALAIGDVGTVEEVIDVVDKKLRVAWITKEEDKRLRQLGYRHKRPDPVAAYAEAGISLLPILADPEESRSGRTSVPE